MPHALPPVVDKFAPAWWRFPHECTFAWNALAPYLVEQCLHRRVPLGSINKPPRPHHHELVNLTYVASRNLVTTIFGAVTEK